MISGDIQRHLDSLRVSHLIERLRSCRERIAISSDGCAPEVHSTELSSALYERALFRFAGRNVARGDEDSPIVAELRTIAARQDCVIMVAHDLDSRRHRRDRARLGWWVGWESNPRPMD
jgi:hypothetical protein